MTNEELFNENIKLAYYMAKKYSNVKIEKEDLIQIALLGLWKAAKSYNSDKVKFNSYAGKVIQNEINYELRKKRISTISLNDTVTNTERICIEDLIPDKKDMLNEIENKELVQQIKQKAKNDTERRIIDAYLSGKKVKQIAKELGVSRQWIYYKTQKIKEKNIIFNE